MHPFFVKVEKINNKLIIPAIILLFFIIIFELFIHIENHALELAVEVADYFVIAVFVVDLIFLFHKAKTTKFFFKNYWLDILAVFPFILIFKALSGILEFFSMAERLTIGQAIFHETVEVSKAAAKAEEVAKVGEKLGKAERVAKVAEQMGKAGRYVRLGARAIRITTKTHSIIRFKRRKKERLRD